MPPSGFGQALSDPLGSLLQLLTGVLTHVLASARVDLDGVLQHYLFTTVDPASSGRPLTANQLSASAFAMMTIGEAA